MKFARLLGFGLLSGCASGAFRSTPPEQVERALAGRTVVIQAGCPDRSVVLPQARGLFQSDFSDLPENDTGFGAFSHNGFWAGLRLGAVGKRLLLDKNRCYISPDSASLPDEDSHARLFLDTSHLDPTKVYLARTRIAYALEYEPAPAGAELPDMVKDNRASLVYGLYDPISRRLVVSGTVQGRASTPDALHRVVTRRDWQDAAALMGSDLRTKLDRMLQPLL